jgi:hypothetical protein
LRPLDKGPTMAAITSSTAIGIWRPRCVVIKNQSCIASFKVRDQALLGLDMQCYRAALAAAMANTQSRAIVPPGGQGGLRRCRCRTIGSLARLVSTPALAWWWPCSSG